MRLIPKKERPSVITRYRIRAPRPTEDSWLRSWSQAFPESFSEYDESNLRLGVHLYHEGDFHLKTVLPSGGDTGYGAILATSDHDFLVAYYSSHEYPPEAPGSNVYLASLTIDQTP